MNIWGSPSQVFIFLLVNTMSSMNVSFVQAFDDQGVGVFAKPVATEKMMKKMIKIFDFWITLFVMFVIDWHFFEHVI